MRKVSVSEIAAWNSCRLKWEYRYKHNLEAAESAPMMASGTAVHAVVEAQLRGQVTPEQWEAKAEQVLQAALAGREDVQEQVQRYLPGVLRALARLPRWLLEEKDWHVEEPVEWTWPAETTFPQYEMDKYGSETTIWGKPDFYRLVGDDELQIVEVKSTSSDQQPMDYLLWNPQHRQYAVMLDKLYPDRLVKVKYVVVRTDRGAERTVEAEWVMTKQALAYAEKLMVAAAREIGRLDVVPNYSRACGFCDFNKLCQVDITGGQSKGLWTEWYLVREPRE